jgi:tetratricopeptide (TPR) repeat protein
MLGIPFLKTLPKTRQPSARKIARPTLNETLREARTALDSRQPSRAHWLVTPWLEEKDCPAEVRLIAGRALAAQGRYAEAMGHFEIYVAGNPDSVDGLICAALTAARARNITRAVDWFNLAARALTGRAKTAIEPLLSSNPYDPVAIEDMVADVEAHPEDKERALALACALGRAGHFRAVEKFLPAFY